MIFSLTGWLLKPWFSNMILVIISLKTKQGFFCSCWWQFVFLLSVNLIIQIDWKQIVNCGVRHMPYIIYALSYIPNTYVHIWIKKEEELESFASETLKVCSLMLFKTCFFHICTTKLHSGGSYFLRSFPFSRNILRNAIYTYKIAIPNNFCVNPCAYSVS